MGEDPTIDEYLDDLRGRMQVKLARGGAPNDSGTLRLVCLAVALRVADPAGLRLLMKPLSPQLYPALETMLVHVDGDFGDEIAELQDLIADAQEDPAWLDAVQQAMQIDPPENGKGGGKLDGRLWREFPVESKKGRFAVTVKERRADNGSERRTLFA